jgi:tetratricopeptide (TPR) repeat protein
MDREQFRSGLDFNLAELIRLMYFGYLPRAELLEKTLRFVSPVDSPLLWAELQIILGDRYFQQFQEAPYYRHEAKESLSSAIDAYRSAFQTRRSALDPRTHDSLPDLWAEAALRLGTAYIYGVQRGLYGQEVTEEAIYLFSQALEFYTRGRFPEEWADTHYNLAKAYLERGGWDQENREWAIEHAHEALEVFTREGYPERWAHAQATLADAYSERVRGAQEQNLERAIGHYEGALEVFDRIEAPETQARILPSVADAYLSRVRGSETQNANKALSYLARALGLQREIGSKSAVVSILELLATAYSRLGDTRAAQSAYQRAQGISVSVSQGLGQEAEALQDTERLILSEAETTEAYATAGFKDHDVEQPFHVGETYILQAGIQSNVPEGFESVPVTLPSREEPIQIVIVVHTDMVIRPAWSQTYYFHRGQEQQHLNLMLTPTGPGRKEIRVEFIYQLHWLGKVQLEVEVLERSDSASV